MPGPGSYLIGEEEIREVMDVMQSGYLFRYGDVNDKNFKQKVYSLEREFAAYCDSSHALATSSGSGSLLISLLAMGIQPGDEVIVPSYTFVATYSSAIFAGAVPVLCDIDESLNLDPAAVEAKITPKTKAIIPVHMLGNPCNMDAIMDIANRHGLQVLEDACQAAGGSYKGKKLGTIGRMGAFSLNVFKTITTGDGGMVVTNDVDLFNRAFALHDQGHTPNRTGVQVGQRSLLGMNFRVNELLGAVALAQLRKLDGILLTLRTKKAKFKQAISNIPGVRFRTLPDPGGECATLCTVLFDSAEKAGRVARRVLGTATVDNSGWHVYANMEHVNRYLKEADQPHGKGAYPRTDNILSRAINLSVGVVDAGLGAAFGINIKSSDAEIEQRAEMFIKACKS